MTTYSHVGAASGNRLEPNVSLIIIVFIFSKTAISTSITDDTAEAAAAVFRADTAVTTITITTTVVHAFH
ncbi:hypothetical protein TYRP_016062 [Tyrophagus putrescentiae]|nr:hypothetical protein TYRP_016062 [Tyrophagus putrescentiae]